MLDTNGEDSGKFWKGMNSLTARLTSSSEVSGCRYRRRIQNVEIAWFDARSQGVPYRCLMVDNV